MRGNKSITVFRTYVAFYTSILEERSRWHLAFGAAGVFWVVFAYILLWAYFLLFKQ
jgi:hypothetical protein